MKLPIPDDWSGEDWLCAEVRWPDSPLWRAILYGLLSYPTRGRLWDERSGVIIDAQAVGREIWSRNTPFVPCARQSEGAADDGVQVFGSGVVFVQEDLTLCITDVTFEDGKLYKHSGICCKVLICDLTAWQPELGVAPVVENPDPETTDYACRKAYALGTKFYLLWQAFDDCEDSLPTSWDTCVEDFVGLKFNGWRIGEYMLALKSLGWITQGVITAEISETERDMLICKLAEVLSNESTDLTREEFEACEAAIREVWPITLNPEFALVYSSWSEVFGYENAQKVARDSYIYIDADCPCPPESPQPPGEYDWLHSYNFRYDDLFGWNLVTGEQVPGVGLKVNDMERYDAGVNVWKAAGVDATSETFVEFIRMEYSAWPTTETTSAECWVQFDDMGCALDNPELFGHDYIDWSGSQLFEYLKRIRTKSFQATGDPTSGDHVLWKMVVAGSGPDPWPSDP